MTHYFEAAQIDTILKDHPFGDDFLSFAAKISRDELFARQDALFRRCLTRAWATPFYQRHWGEAGIEPGDITGLQDIAKLPVFDKSHIMASIERTPPFGDFAGFESHGDKRPPIIFHTTSGTTGRPQVLLFGPKSREVQNLMLGRIYHMQGVRADDVIHSVYGHGMINGGHYIREGAVHWTRAVFMSAGTGVETRSAQQVQLMKDFGATVIVGFADYIKKLATVARESGLEPGEDIKIRLISGHMGREDKEAVSAAWGGAQCYDWYGVGDTGAIAAEGPDRSGLYIMEDAHYLEICDIDTGAPLPDGEEGDMVCTCLFKDDIYPIIRFNTHDVSRIRTDASPLGWSLKRMEGFLGRSDNMVKLRGINVYPQALGPVLEERDSFAGEFICVVTRDANGRDELTVHAETRAPENDHKAVAADYSALLKSRIGIDVSIALEAPGALADLTQVEKRQKPIRLIDRRFDS